MIAEAALVLPALLLFTLAVLQAGFLGYAAAVARYAAHRGARAAAVAPAAKRTSAGRTAALLAVAAAPGLVPASVVVQTREHETGMPVPVIEARVKVGAPGLLLLSRWSTVGGTCRLPVEPSWEPAARR